jgi:hypothetical protein
LDESLSTLLDWDPNLAAAPEAAATGRHAEGALAPGAGMPGDAGDRSAHKPQRAEQPQQGVRIACVADGFQGTAPLG